MAMQASSEALREMAAEVRQTADDLERIGEGIRSFLGSLGEWNDQQALQFDMVMQSTARLTEQPIDTLITAAPKIEQLADVIDQYNGVSFG